MVFYPGFALYSASIYDKTLKTNVEKREHTLKTLVLAFIYGHMYSFYHPDYTSIGMYIHRTL